MSPDFRDIEIKPVTSDRIFTKAEPLEPPAVTYTVSARNKAPNMPVFAFLRKNYGNVPLREIDSLFGFVEKSTLYGGMVDFPLEPYVKLGFHRFKLLRARPGSLTGF